MMDKKDILELLSVRMLGLVPDDEQLIVATNRGVPAVHNPRSWSGEAFRRIAGRIDGHDMPFLQLEDGRGLMSKMKRLIRSPGKDFSGD